MSLEEVLETCDLDALGAHPLVVAARLQEAGWDVETVSGFDVNELEVATEEERPVILTVRQGKVGVHHLAHAVVLCSIGVRAAVLMDPAVGDYIEASLDDLATQVEDGLGAGLLIGGTGSSTG